MSNHPLAALALGRTLAARPHEQATEPAADTGAAAPAGRRRRKRNGLRTPTRALAGLSQPRRGAEGPFPLDA